MATQYALKEFSDDQLRRWLEEPITQAFFSEITKRRSLQLRVFHCQAPYIPAPTPNNIELLTALHERTVQVRTYTEILDIIPKIFQTPLYDEDGNRIQD